MVGLGPRSQRSPGPPGQAGGGNGTESHDGLGPEVEQHVPDTAAGRRGSARRAGRRPLVVRIALTCVLVVGTGLVATARLFVWPPSTVPRGADAVVVLSGDHGERLPRALDLIRGGLSTTLVEVGEPDSQAAQDLCDRGAAFQVFCLRPSHDSTQTEARAVGQLAQSQRWARVVVVTSTQHATRAGLLFRRCLPGDVDVVAARPPFGWRLMGKLVAIEWAKLGYALTADRTC